MLGVFAMIFSTLFTAPQAAPRPAPVVAVTGVVQDQTTAVLNRVNYNNPAGNLSSPFFGRSVSAQPPRRIQFSIRMRY